MEPEEILLILNDHKYNSQKASCSCGQEFLGSRLMEQWRAHLAEALAAREG